TRFEADRKQREIQILTQEKEIQNLELNRQGVLRNYALSGLILLVLFLGFVPHLYRPAPRTSRDLQSALDKVRTLQGLLPICANCKKIRDDTGYWNQIETYIKDRSQAEFTHGICPDCAQRLYPQDYKPK